MKKRLYSQNTALFKVHKHKAQRQKQKLPSFLMACVHVHFREEVRFYDVYVAITLLCPGNTDVSERSELARVSMTEQETRRWH